MPRVTRSFRKLVRSVTREYYIKGTTDEKALQEVVLKDPRIVGFSPLLIQIAIEIIIALVRYWLSNRITIPSVEENDLEPWGYEGDQDW